MFFLFQSFPAELILPAAPLVILNILLFLSATVTSHLFITGSKGLNSFIWYDEILSDNVPTDLAFCIIALSIGSLSSSLDAREAKSKTSSEVKSLNDFTSARVSSFLVIVPVLSEQRISIPAISSIATSLLTIAFSLLSMMPRLPLLQITPQAMQQG